MDSQERANKSDDTMMSYQPESTPRLCANGCGFFGTSATHNLCSKCYTDFLKEPLNPTAVLSVSSHVVINNSTSTTTSPTFFFASSTNNSSHVITSTSINGASTTKNRCQCCKKKVGLMGFGCRCEGMFCGMHMYPEEHACTFDFKVAGRVALAKENPVCKGDKLQSRV